MIAVSKRYRTVDTILPYFNKLVLNEMAEELLTYKYFYLSVFLKL